MLCYAILYIVGYNCDPGMWVLTKLRWFGFQVIYIGVTDFLQKREREKFEKEEAANKKKTGKKKKVRARAGPRGFGQKIDDDYDED
jgi:hypothetical protein